VRSSLSGGWIRSSRHLRRDAVIFRARRSAKCLPARPKKATCIAGFPVPAISSRWFHNGIEYGLMAAYAKGLNILRHANVGKQGRTIDAETMSLRNPEHYQYDFNLADVAEVWRRGSVVASWLLDLTAIALFGQHDLSKFSGHVSDSGEGRWTIASAIDEAVPAPVLSAALYQRFRSSGEEDFGNKLLSAMRFEFGGHARGKCESLQESEFGPGDRCRRNTREGPGNETMPRSARFPPAPT
jgi:hypothetical protein